MRRMQKPGVNPDEQAQLRRRERLNGMLIGIVLPLTAFVIIHELNNLISTYWLGGRPLFSLRLQLIMALLTNIIPARIFYRQERDEALRALAGITILQALAVAVYVITTI